MQCIRVTTIAAVFVALGSLSKPTSACGGLFCDGGPRGMPVDQKGENILFVVDGGKVEAHIQIQYEGDPAKFAWVLPVPTVPEAVEVGSQLLFGNLLAATVPMYAMNYCPVLAPNGGGGVFQAPESVGVQIISQETVGAYEVTVLSGQSSTEVVTWLNDNGYQQIPTAPALLDDYVARGFVFVAAKLTGGAGVDAIHPLVVRYPDNGDGACVPLELTAVAALPDMGVRAFFLGNGRVVPKNYFHVEPNPLQFDWVNFADNYDEVISRAVDEAGGHAFVTEYAGASNVVSTLGIYDSRWDPNPFISVQIEGVVAELESQALALCGGGTCTFYHPLLLPLLRQYLPAPAGVDELGFYSCLSCYPMDLNRAAWDGQAFARDFLERIITPGLHATQLLAKYAYLTRLFTEISPDEMTEDPLFLERDDLPSVANLRILPGTCGAPSDPILSQFNVTLDQNGMWPTFGADMPWALNITHYTDASDALIADNTSTVLGMLDTWNASQETTTGSTVGSFPTGTGGSPSVTASPTGEPASPTTNAPMDTTNASVEGGGCGCRFAQDVSSSSAGVIASFGALVLRRRRRTRQKRMP